MHCTALHCPAVGAVRCSLDARRLRRKLRALRRRCAAGPLCHQRGSGTPCTVGSIARGIEIPADAATSGASAAACCGGVSRSGGGGHRVPGASGRGAAAAPGFCSARRGGRASQRSHPAQHCPPPTLSSIGAWATSSSSSPSPVTRGIPFTRPRPHSRPHPLPAYRGAMLRHSSRLPIHLLRTKAVWEVQCSLDAVGQLLRGDLRQVPPACACGCRLMDWALHVLYLGSSGWETL